MDDFDYPPAQRANTMSLQSIEKAGSSLKLGRRQNPAALKVDDIPGAQASSSKVGLRKRLLNRPELFGCDDIAGTAPSRLIPQVVNRPNEFNMSNMDIEGSRPRRTELRTQRVTDPVNPRYNLPSFQQAPLPVPEQRNVTNQIDDIPGTRSKTALTSKLAARDTFNVDDIEGARADSTLPARMRANGKDRTMDNPSINFNKPEVFATNRCTNPLSPRYKVGIPGGTSPDDWEGIGHIPGNHPKPAKAARKADVNMLSLRTDDVQGAYPSSAIPGPDGRKVFRNPVDISDIHAAHPQGNHTAFHYKDTQRHLDPMNPDYGELKWKSQTHPVSNTVGAKGVSQANGSSMDAHRENVPAPPRRSPETATAKANSGGYPGPNYKDTAPSNIKIPSVMSLPK